MTYGESTETIARKVTGVRYSLCGLGLPHQAGCLLYTGCLAGTRHTCYSCNRRRDCLPDLEEEARLQLVKQEGVHV